MDEATFLVIIIAVVLVLTILIMAGWFGERLSLRLWPVDLSLES